ncbi:MAG TPA: pyridoxal phosphate-dependent aminotransferase family protein [Candidatus Omnitrophota bacterium]|jgi:glycine C-acetyltransferase|nr:MAG: putative pyridoxal phosphate-dependent acyltransferase [Candidatus Omnitrophica bacterium ADurb.Bin314]HQB94606.1 pyridoxal phosphate-dependent aminotransferase family protein [Candidatus Omnitrophota bacterium]
MSQKNLLFSRIEALNYRTRAAKKHGVYPYMHCSDAVSGVHITVNGRPMLQFASYSYLDLLGHPKINAAAKQALDKFGTGTHGVRFLTGTTRVHVELEKKIASFKKTEDALAISTGYGANFGTISALLGRNDTVISDKINHASIVDGCILSRAHFVRFEHNDMEALDKALHGASRKGTKLVVTDAVFSMDGDIVDLPEMIRVCRKHKAMLMVDEAHSLGVLGKKGTGIEEHFGIDPREGLIDIKMGTLSKTIPSIGGYIAGSSRLVNYLKHSIRPFIFSAALPPASAAAAKTAFEVMGEETWRVEKLRKNTAFFLKTLKDRGFDTLRSQTPIVPIIIGEERKALEMTHLAKEKGIFIVPILPPAVEPNTARIRATVTAGHSLQEIERAVHVFEQIARSTGILR